MAAWLRKEMPHPTFDLISLESLWVAAGSSIAGQDYGTSLRKLQCTPSVHRIALHPISGKTRSVGWSLNYIRASTARQVWESFTIFLDIYWQFVISGTQSE